MLFVQGSSFIHLGFKELTETLNKNLIKMSEKWKVVKQDLSWKENPNFVLSFYHHLILEVLSIGNVIILSYILYIPIRITYD